MTKRCFPDTTGVVYRPSHRSMPCYSPVATSRACLGAGSLDTLDHDARRAVLQTNGDLVAVVSDDRDYPTARLRVTLKNTFTQ